MSTLIIPVGIPGSGKSTWTREVYKDATWVSSDEIREGRFGSRIAAHEPGAKERNNFFVFQEFHRRITHGLANGEDVIADATNLNHEARAKLRTIADFTVSLTHLILFKNVEQAIDRNLARVEDQIVPEEAMVYMMQKYYDTLSRLPGEEYTRVTEITSVR